MPIVYGSLFFTYMVLAIGLIAFLSSAVKNDFFYSLVALISLVLVFQFLSDFQPITYVSKHWWQVAVGAVGYIVIGVCWVAYKWYLLSKAQLVTYLDWKIRNPNTSSSLSSPPSPRNHKERIISWMAFWPFSMAVYFLFDALRELFLAIYVRISGGLMRIGNHVYRDVK